MSLLFNEKNPNLAVISNIIRSCILTFIMVNWNMINQMMLGEPQIVTTNQWTPKDK